MSEYGFNNEGEHDKLMLPPEGDPKKPHKKVHGKGIIALVAAAGILAGSFLTGFVILPMTSNTRQQPAQAEAYTTTAALIDDLPSLDQAGESNNQKADEATEPEDAQDESITTLPTDEETEVGQQSSGNAPGTEYANNPVPEIAEKAKASVVSIDTYVKTLQSGQKPTEERVSAGTGFVIDGGYIITNSHVIESGNLIKITTHEGEEYTAELVGKHTPTEIAVLKVDSLDIEPMDIGDSSAVKTGELVIAIGNPLGERLQNTVTVGYLSAESREILLNGEEMTMLQTDAAINPGNSGGPLLNDRGEVIGITTMKSIIAGFDAYGNTISAEGLGFAIPINEAMEIADQLIEYGSVPQPGIGFSYVHISEEDAELWEVPNGIMIMEITPASPAQRAGLKVNDVIVEIDGVDLTQDDAEVPSFKDRELGESVEAVVWRDGTKYRAEFILADLSLLSATE